MANRIHERAARWRAVEQAEKRSRIETELEAAQEKRNARYHKIRTMLRRQKARAEQK